MSWGQEVGKGKILLADNQCLAVRVLEILFSLVTEVIWVPDLLMNHLALLGMTGLKGNKK